MTDAKQVDQTESTNTSNKNKLSNCQGCNIVVESPLYCPTCIKLKLPVAVFCSQNCFKNNWPLHKHAHLTTKDQSISLKKKFDPHNVLTWVDDPNLRPFCSFNFTGSLRPWPRSKMQAVPNYIPKPDYAESGNPRGEILTKNQRIIVEHTDEEIERLRECCLLARRSLDLAHSMIKPGVSTDEIDKAVHEFIITNNAYPSPLNYYNFPKSCCTSINEVICHGIPDSRPLQNGDIVNVDITVFYKGMHGDLNETFICGDAEHAKHLIKGAYEAMMYAIAECKPGMLYRNIGNIISRVAEQRKLSVVRSYCGHGIGSLFHTHPNVPHYKKNKAIGIMKPGHVFTIEPMINAGNWQDITWPDDWTSCTVDGSLSAQFEHTILITESGCEILTARLLTSPQLEISVPSEIEYLIKRVVAE